MAKAKAPTRVELGSEYVDRITGYRGTALFRQTTKNGCVLVHLKPRVKDGTNEMPKGEWIFETQLDTLDGVGIDSKPEKETLKLLDKRYNHPPTGYSGYASSHVEALNGHQQVALDGPLKLDGGMGESWNVDVQDLVEVETKKKTGIKPERGPRNERLR